MPSWERGAGGPRVAATMVMNAEKTRHLLLAQHDRLRAYAQTCTGLARLHELGEEVARDLDLAIEILREELIAHNAAETVVIRKLLQGPSAWGSRLIDGMLDEHLAEHAALSELLSGTRAEVAGRIEQLADELDAHMTVEERTFLAPTTLRDDILQARARELPAE